MSLADFEDRMLKLKGIKLPAVSLIGTNPAKQATVTANPLVGTLLKEVDDTDVKVNNISSELDDIMVGIIRSFDVSETHKGNKLTVGAVRSILHKLPFISTPAIIDNFSYSRSQAKHYSRACRMIITFYNRHNVKKSFKSLSQYTE